MLKSLIWSQDKSPAPFSVSRRVLVTSPTFPLIVTLRWSDFSMFAQVARLQAFYALLFATGIALSLPLRISPQCSSLGEARSLLDPRSTPDEATSGKRMPADVGGGDDPRRRRTGVIRGPQVQLGQLGSGRRSAFTPVVPMHQPASTPSVSSSTNGVQSSGRPQGALAPPFILNSEPSPTVHHAHTGSAVPAVGHSSTGPNTSVRPGKPNTEHSQPSTIERQFWKPVPWLNPEKFPHNLGTNYHICPECERAVSKFMPDGDWKKHVEKYHQEPITKYDWFVCECGRSVTKEAPHTECVATSSEETELMKKAKTYKYNVVDWEKPENHQGGTNYVLCRDCGEPLNFYRTPSVWKKHGKTHKVKEDPENYIATHGRYVVCDCGHPIHEDIGTSLTRSSRDSHNRSENHISWLALAKERSRG